MDILGRKGDLWHFSEAVEILPSSSDILASELRSLSAYRIVGGVDGIDQQLLDMALGVPAEFALHLSLDPFVFTTASLEGPSGEDRELTL